MRLFRILVVGEIVLAVLSSVAASMTEGLLPEPLRGYASGETEMITTQSLLLMFLGVPLIVGLLVASVGLFFFWRPARMLYLICVVFGIALVPLAGPYVDAGYGELLEDVASMISGAILALAWFSPLAQVFDRKRTPPPTPQSQQTPSGGSYT